MDRSLRDALAMDIAAFLLGQLTNDELLFENPNWDAYQRSDDIAIGRIKHELWQWFDDARATFRLEDTSSLEPEERAIFERCVLFLWSDELYQYPDGQPGCGGIIVYALLTSITLGWYGRWFEGRMRQAGDQACWPFTDETVLARERARWHERFRDVLGSTDARGTGEMLR